MQNLQKADVAKVIAESNANFYFITLTVPNGDVYSWRGNGFELAITSRGDGPGAGLIPIKANVAERAFYDAVNSARNLPFESGNLSIVGLPKFSQDV